MRILLADFIILNIISLAIAAIGTLLDREPFNTFILVTFLLSGLVLIFGGYLGFFVSSISYSGLLAYLRLRRGAKEEGQKKGVKEKPEKRGLRTVALGVLLLVESLLLALLMIY